MNLTFYILIKHFQTIWNLVWVWIVVGLLFCALVFFWLGPVHCSRDPQVRKNANLTLKLGPTALFTHVKIISLQYFQFSVFSNKRYLSRPLVHRFSTPRWFLDLQYAFPNFSDFSRKITNKQFELPCKNSV